MSVKSELHFPTKTITRPTGLNLIRVRASIGITGLIGGVILAWHFAEVGVVVRSRPNIRAVRRDPKARGILIGYLAFDRSAFVKISLMETPARNV